MSGPYRLQTARPRQTPSPLQFDEPSYKQSTVFNDQGGQTLLYDIPSSTTMTPPTSPPGPKSLISPTSPSFAGRSRRGAPTPPPSGRNRSATPSGIAASELEAFSVHCRAWYFNQDEESGKQMTQTMSSLLPSQRAPFARLQASIRADYHRSVNVRRNAEFRAHITAMQPGGSLNAHSRVDPHGALARKERYERMEHFVLAWCTLGMPGTQPFFEALWAIFRLQVIPQNLGGAGAFRIEWELDDAVFKEAAGREFMLEAIDILKGVFGFEEHLSSKASSNSNDLYLESTTIHSRSQSQPLPSDQKLFRTSRTVQPKRSRAPSDPFIDTPALSHSVAAASSQSSGTTAVLLGGLASDSIEESPSSIFEDQPTSPRGDNFDEDDEEYMRTWLSPDLSNPELLELLKLFPSFVSRRALPRFPPQSLRHPDIEEGEEEGSEGKRIHFGTGSMWVSSKTRQDGWKGGWWTRFVLWWRRMFC